ncbi:MAG: glycosyltransferase family 2 protein [Desulfobacca sp.]|uniref:glycosyltransferase family 2 protein n=1 Tax=Desulfobacca sp. TaxID=2067990 RepID=UPI0040496261
MKILWADWRGRLPYRRYHDWEDRPRRLRAQLFCLLTLVSGGFYLAWLVHQLWQQRTLHIAVFLATEMAAYFLLLVLAVDVWRLRFHHPEGLPVDRPHPVDVLVTCCGEPLPVIKATLTALRQLEYHPYTVYVLDDAGDDRVAALAQSLGFFYYSRVKEGLPRSDAKSGNLNFGLSRSQGEIILVLDADQVPQPDIISRMIGFFRLPKVAYVQSRQDFLLPEGDPFYNRDNVFYEAVQLSNDQANAVISCGSGVLYRRQALMELGGFVTWNIVEDFTTSYNLVSRGWKGIYFPYALSRGLAPDTLVGVVQQRYQWCLDTMRLFFWDNPWRKAGLTLRQRLHFTIVMLTYAISGLVIPIFYFLPLYCYVTGRSFLVEHEVHYLLWRGLYLICTILAFHYLFHRKHALKQLKMLCGLFPVYAWGTLAALWYPPGRKPAYRVNLPLVPKPTQTFLAILPHLMIIGLHLTLPFLALQLGWASPRLIAGNALFSALTVWILGEMVILAMSQPRGQEELYRRQIYREV